MSVAIREPVSKVDNAWWHMDTVDNHMVVTSVLVFDRPVDPKAVRELFEERMMKFERFRQRIVTPLRDLGEPQWELDPSFDMDAHMHRVALPAPGGEEELRALVSEISSRPLDRGKPLWEDWIVDGYSGGGALITRIHHCVADGIALTRLLLSLTDDDAEDAPVGEPEWWQVRPKRLAREPKHRGTVGMAAHLAALVAREGVTSVAHPNHAGELIREGAGELAALTRVTFLPTEAKTSLKGPLGTRKVVAWSGLIPLAEVKQAAHAVNGTVNDVLVSAVAGGLRRYLIARGDDVPESLELHATVPVNLRRLDGPIEMGNRFGLVYPALPVGIADPLKRLKAVKANIDKIKGTPEAVMAIGVLDLLGHTPQPLEKLFIDFFTTKSSMVLTNVPGPRHFRRFAGARLTRVLSWAPPSGNLAMSVSIFSYAGDITVALQTDAATIPDPQGIVDAIHVELDELRRAGVRRRRPAVARATPTTSRRGTPTTSSRARPRRAPSRAPRRAG